METGNSDNKFYLDDESEKEVDSTHFPQGIEYSSIVKRRDDLIIFHQNVVEGIKALTNEYNTKIQELNQQQLLVLGEIRGLNSLLPQELVRAN